MQNGDVGATPEFDGDHVKAHALIKEKTFKEYAGCQMQSCVLFLEFEDILQVVGQTLRTLVSLTMQSPNFLNTPSIPEATDSLSTLRVSA